MTTPLTKRTLHVGESDWQAYADRLTLSTPMVLSQHPRHMAALLSMGVIVRLDLYERDQALIAVVPSVTHRRFKLLHFTSIFCGPLFDDGASDADKLYVFQSIASLRQNWRWRFLRVTPALDDSPSNRALLKQAGLHQIVTGYSTAWLDLRPDIDQLRSSLDGKWRNQLKKAEQTDFEVSHSFDNIETCRWLLEKEHQQAGQKGHSTTSGAYVDHYTALTRLIENECKTKGQHSLLLVQAYQRREKLAGALFLLHGTSATYQVGWTGDKGRSLNAQNQVLWHAIALLKQQGIDYLDMGGVDSDQLQGVSRFKLGTGARPLTWVGTFA